MLQKHKYRSDQEWMNLVTECRQSGLADNVWCEHHGIPISTFYNAIRRLRRKACPVPEHTNVSPVIDLTSEMQDVVQIDLVPDRDTRPAAPSCMVPAGMHLDNLHTIKILFNNGTSLHVSNGADANLLKQVIAAVGGSRC